MKQTLNVRAKILSRQFYDRCLNRKLRNFLGHKCLVCARKIVDAKSLQIRILIALYLCFYHTNQTCELLFCTLSFYRHLVFDQVFEFLK